MLFEQSTTLLTPETPPAAQTQGREGKGADRSRELLQRAVPSAFATPIMRHVLLGQMVRHTLGEWLAVSQFRDLVVVGLVNQAGPGLMPVPSLEQFCVPSFEGKSKLIAISFNKYCYRYYIHQRL